MDRRDFLKGMVGVSFTGLAALVMPALPVAARVNTAPALFRSQTLNRTFKGTLDGLIFESHDGGATWRAIANFGSHCVIQALFERQDKIHAQVGVQANSFLLSSADARVWRTVS